MRELDIEQQSHLFLLAFSGTLNTEVFLDIANGKQNTAKKI